MLEYRNQKNYKSNKQIHIFKVIYCLPHNSKFLLRAANKNFKDEFVKLIDNTKSKRQIFM